MQCLQEKRDSRCPVGNCLTGTEKAAECKLRWRLVMSLCVSKEVGRCRHAVTVCGMSETVFQTTGLDNESCIPQKHRTALKKPFDQVVWEGAPANQWGCPGGGSPSARLTLTPARVQGRPCWCP